MNYGIDCLPGARYPSLILDHFPANFGCGVFSSVFGDSLPLIDRLLAKGHTPFVRVHIGWDDNHKFTTNDFPALVKDAQRWNVLIHKYPRVDFYISGACEHELNAVDALQLSKLVSAACPQSTYVNSPTSKGAIVPGVINEQHGGGMPRSSVNSFSYDGVGAEDSDVETTKNNFKNSKYFMLWTYRLNGHWGSNDTADRQHRDGWPDIDVIYRLAYLHNAKGETHLPNNWLYKSVGEESKNDPKSGHPVFIIPVHAPSIEIKNLAGHHIATFPNYNDNYSDGRARYYGPDYGYKLAKLCGGLCNVFINGQKQATVNLGFRDGNYR